MTFNEISLLLIFLFPLAYSPGPGNIFLQRLGRGMDRVPVWRPIWVIIWQHLSSALRLV